LNQFRDWKPILLRFLLFAIISGVSIYIIAPNYFLVLPRDRFLIWVVIMISYPLWSAFPQEFIYRTWFFHRYRNLFKSEIMFILINAMFFSFSHIIFRNWLAIVLTFAGGIMFALTYKKSRSLIAVFAEHVLYGNFIFTIGIGQYFYLPMGS
jgi:membrane protease YdiL (CAAX protease family)